MTGWVLLGAHCDDLAYSLAATLLTGRLGRCQAITLFSRSGYTPTQPDGDVSVISRLRQEEDRRFFERVALCDLRWLDLDDAPLRHDVSRQSLFDLEPSPAEVDWVERALREVVPRDAPLLAPLALGRHLDHRLAHRAALALARDGCATAFYEDLPYAAFQSPAEIAAAVAECESQLGRRLRPELWCGGDLESPKRWAVESYRSQSDHGTLAALLRHASRVGGERVWC